LLYLGAYAIGKEALKTGSNIINEFLNKEPEHPVSDIKKRFGEAKNNLEGKCIRRQMSDLRTVSCEFPTEFIHMYREYPCLWKVKSKEYSDRIKKNLAYEHLTTKLK